MQTNAIVGADAWPQRRRLAASDQALSAAGPEGTMPRLRDYAKMIDLIYEAALDPSAWPDVANRLADLCGATLAQIIGHDSETCAVTNIAPRADPETVRSYTQHWVYHNPLIEPTQRIPLGSVFTFDRIVPRRELARTAIYNEFFVPAGMEERLGVRLLAEGSFTALANLYRPGHKGAFDSADAELLASLVPHLRRALQLNVRLADLEISRTASAEILDRLSQASLLVDAACRVLFANRAHARRRPRPFSQPRRHVTQRQANRDILPAQIRCKRSRTHQQWQDWRRRPHPALARRGTHAADSFGDPDPRCNRVAGTTPASRDLVRHRPRTRQHSSRREPAA